MLRTAGQLGRADRTPLVDPGGPHPNGQAHLAGESRELLAGRAVVREFLQQQANPEAVSAELFELLENTEYRAQVKLGLGRVRENLGAGDGARNMAQLVLSLIEQ